MTHGSLFSGIGGFDLAAEWMGWDNVFHCEWNKFGQKVLKHYWPNAISYENICTTDFTVHRGNVDIITGGFPCQPYSTAGKRLGKADERHLFPQMLRCIKEIKPRWIIGENVRGLVSWNGGMVFHEVYDDLERQGYEVLSFLIPAASVNAPHRRDRIWFIAHSKTHGQSFTEGTNGRQEYKQNNWGRVWHSFDTDGSCWTVADTDNTRFETFNNEKSIMGQKNRTKTFSRNTIESIYSRNGWEKFPSQSPICNGDDGLSDRLDSITFPKWRTESIKAGGNAIVPQVAYQIFKTIEEYERIGNTTPNN